MCGIISYVGSQKAIHILIEGLKRLEYRGYDSAGIAIISKNQIDIRKSTGHVQKLEEQLKNKSLLKGHIGIAHTRWATHGSPTELNAHPHYASTKNGETIAIVHNGIIENYLALKKYLIQKGHHFYSETDSEIIAKLIAQLYTNNLETTVQLAMKELVGAYAIAVICTAEPNKIVCSKKGSPLIIGVTDHGFIAASDASAIIAHTSQAFTLEDNQIVCLSAEMKESRWDFQYYTTDINNSIVDNNIIDLEINLNQIELGNYTHFMMKEIMEQPESIKECLKGRVDHLNKNINLGGLKDISNKLIKTKRFILSAQGTAYHAAMIGKYMIEDLSKVPSYYEYASEFRYRNPIIEKNTTFIAISQSGETADTLYAVKESKDKGMLTLGIVNVGGSSISRETDAGIYLHMGPEIGVASTKAFVGQMLVLLLFSLYMGKRKFLSERDFEYYLEYIKVLPTHISSILSQSDMIKEKIKKYIDRNNWLFLGRGYQYPIALEGALKLKEISYIHAEGMSAAEMKHGPIALIDKDMPVVFIAIQDGQYDKVISNIEEVKARGGRIIAIATENDTNICQYTDDIFYVPDAPSAIQPILTVIPLQLLAYHAAVLRGHDVDKPRNLAKSVTVE